MPISIRDTGKAGNRAARTPCLLYDSYVTGGTGTFSSMEWKVGEHQREQGQLSSNT